jgi:hypothetical protein
MPFSSSYKTDCCNILGGIVHIGPYRTPNFTGVGAVARPYYPIENRDLGEVMTAEITQETDTKERMSHRTPIGGLSCSFTRVQRASLKLKVDCTSADNRALAMMGLLKNVPATVVADEPVSFIKNPAGAGRTLVPTQYLIDPALPINIATLDDVPVTLVLGVDYLVEQGHLYILDSAAVASAVGPDFAENLLIDYTSLVQQQIESSLVTQQPYVLTFAGFSQGGSSGVVAYQAGVRYAKLKPTKIDLITDDFDQFDFEFDLLPDPALQSNPNYSPYYWGFFGAKQA